MAYTYEQLSTMTVVELRKIADEIQNDELQGHNTMHKEKLLPALCRALGIEAHVHHEVKGINKGEIKMNIRSLKKERDVALQAHDKTKLKEVRTKIKRLKRTLRKALV